MSSEQKKNTINDSTIARIAGNLLSGWISTNGWPGDNAVRNLVAESAVLAARAIAAEVQRTSADTD